MHGNQRNADDYRDAWQEHAKEHEILVLVPEFSERDFPGSHSYNLAGVVDDRGAFSLRDQWAFKLIDTIFSEGKKDQELEATRFYLYGHSAGGQFVHRYVMFANSSLLGLAITANPGGYAFPTKEAMFPYGLKDFSLPFEARAAFGTEMVVLLGTKDTDPDHKHLRRAQEAMLQGKHRFERGKKFFSDAEAAARVQGLAFQWKQRDAPGVAHSNAGMSKAAIEIILREDL